jgi:hypothetical protein
MSQSEITHSQLLVFPEKRVGFSLEYIHVLYCLISIYRQGCFSNKAIRTMTLLLYDCYNQCFHLWDKLTFPTPVFKNSNEDMP